MVTRQIPRPTELLELMKFKKPELNAKRRRLSSALTIDDLRTIAKRRTPKAAFDYTDGAAEGELSLGPRAAGVRGHRVPPVDPARRLARSTPRATIFGGPSALPFGIAPTGFTRLMQTEGEIAGAGRGGRRRHPVHALDARHDLDRGRQGREPGRPQLVPALRDARARDLLRARARAPRPPGFDTLFFTVDTPVAGARLRDKRNGFSIPPQLTLGTIVNAIPRPWWWWDFLTTPKLEFASLSSTGGTVGELLDAAMDPTISFDDLTIIRDMWPGKLVIKGVQNVEDAKTPRRSRASTASCSPTTAAASSTARRSRSTCCPTVVREVGKDIEVAIDTGIMNGADIVAVDRARRQVHPHRPRLPLRPHGRRPRRRRPHDRDPHGRDRAHDEAARRALARRARAPRTSPSCSGWCPSRAPRNRMRGRKGRAKAPRRSPFASPQVVGGRRRRSVRPDASRFRHAPPATPLLNPRRKPRRQAGPRTTPRPPTTTPR